jgi:hypothetical protein
LLARLLAFHVGTVDCEVATVSMLKERCASICRPCLFGRALPTAGPAAANGPHGSARSANWPNYFKLEKSSAAQAVIAADDFDARSRASELIMLCGAQYVPPQTPGASPNKLLPLISIESAASSLGEFIIE